MSDVFSRTLWHRKNNLTKRNEVVSNILALDEARNDFGKLIIDIYSNSYIQRHSTCPNQLISA